MARIRGLKEALAALGQLPIEITNKVQRKAVTAGAKVIRNAVLQGVMSQGLVRTGRMLKGTRIKLHKDELGRTFATIGIKSWHWHLHEFGSRRERARPFLRPALAAAETAARTAVQQVLQRELAKLAKKKVSGR